MKLQQSFKTGKKKQATTVSAKVSSTYVLEARRDPQTPRTMKQKDAVVIKINKPFRKIIGLRTAYNEWRSLKRDPNIPTFMDWDELSRAQMIQVVIGYGNTPSSILAMILGATPGQIGAIRRYHNSNWRKQGNQHIIRAYSHGGFFF